MFCMNKEKALLTGILLGDGLLGVYGRQHKIAVTGHSIEDRDFLFDVVKPLFENLFNKKAKINTRKDRKAIDVYLYSKPILLKIKNEWGLSTSRSTCREKKIPKSIIKNTGLMKKFISGLF